MVRVQTMNWKKETEKKFLSNYFMHTMPLCNNVTNILLILLDKRVSPTEVWRVVSTVTGFLEIVFLFNLVSMRLLYWVSNSMSDNHWLYSLNSTNTSQIPAYILQVKPSELRIVLQDSFCIFQSLIG